MSSRIYFMLVAIFTVAGVFQFSGQVSGAQHCGMNTNVLGQLVSQCEKYVLKSGPKIRPSPGCCAVVKKVDVPCVCKFVTKQIEEIISIEKMVYVARSCGIKISAGTKCGSFTVRSA
ncbi:AAI domain-containing protein [Citrus sinensis]|uniref:AAI domain-containing protein n=1 Tax=Citrus sinensis TaxID=2711 RepID=A0ACB8MWN1_CITSI|nr:AAI domain-containing protein [Citrus sinensis]